MKAYIFPGQGSQARGMGGDLFDAYPEMTVIADDVLGYSIKQLCLEDARDELNSTQFTQPALFVVNALSYRRRLEETGAAPDYLAGHSLGEFNALLAASCFDFATGLQLVRKRGELMSQASGGGMAAIINATKDQIEAILQDNGLSNIDLANFNAPKQIAISGAAEEIEKAAKLFNGDMLFFPLKTSGAFHSRLMRPSQNKFKSFLKDFTLVDPQIPVIANVTARPYKDGQVAATLTKQIASSVRWTESVEYLLQLAHDRGEEAEIEEIGHGNVLTKLVRTIRQQVANSGAQREAANGKAAAEPVSAEPAAKAAQVASTTIVATLPPQPVVKGNAAEKVRAWNSRYPIGTRVQSVMKGYGELETSSEATVLFGHRAAVYMKGYNGYFDLDEVTPVPV